ncbi:MULTISPECIES: trypsin-like serine protease [Methylocystis]|uniref:trypsin-like serine peptidase n=1 Tax=Methylocystis TaxID=133 RepID=UPI0024B8BB01|nr:MULTISPECIES: trypsin-like serine protease [Methylocystis]MDJ0450992.1 trypsin-like serine protease [Methylocystis sp. JR02]
MKSMATALMGFLCITAAYGQAVPETLAPHPNARSLDIEGSATTKAFTGQSAAIIYDIQTGASTPVTLSGDDPTLPEYGEPPMNGVRFDLPDMPPNPSFPRIEFNDGATFCSSTVIGPRHLLTAGHCVFDGGSFRQNATAYPGYTNGASSPEYGAFRAVRFIAFSGWTQGHDFAHDVALVEIDRDLPATITRHVMEAAKPNCQTPNGFDRYFYVEGDTRLLKNLGLVHIGCKQNTLFFFIGEGRGSSGSSALRQGSGGIYAVRSNFLGPVGYDAWITPAKRCFLTGRAGTPSC